MDFRSQIAAADGWAAIAADALVVVLVGDRAPTNLAKALAAPLSDAVQHGDFAFKAGRTLYLPRTAGVKASRVVFAAAADASAKAFKSAVSAALASFKGSKVQHAAVAFAGELGADHAEALVTAVGDAVY